MPNLDFGKYAVFIAPAYLLSLAVIAGAVLDTLLRARHWKREVARREALKSQSEKRKAG
jgi:heme exporter protein CcmD